MTELMKKAIAKIDAEGEKGGTNRRPMSAPSADTDFLRRYKNGFKICNSDRF